MERRLRDVVEKGYKSSVKPESLPTKPVRSAAEAVHVLENLRPTAGNLADSEAWRRMIGGRNRFNCERQQIARARREAILTWLWEYRTLYWSDHFEGHFRVDRITVRHGDGAMLARALRVGKATICRDLSVLQAVYPADFGIVTCGIDYETYMCGWRENARRGHDQAQPYHDLRYPANQHGPIARTRRAAARAIGCGSHTDRPIAQNDCSTTSEGNYNATFPAVDEPFDFALATNHFLKVLETNCPKKEMPRPIQWHQARQTA